MDTMPSYLNGIAEKAKARTNIELKRKELYGMLNSSLGARKWNKIQSRIQSIGVLNIIASTFYAIGKESDDVFADRLNEFLEELKTAPRYTSISKLPEFEFLLKITTREEVNTAKIVALNKAKCHQDEVIEEFGGWESPNHLIYINYCELGSESVKIKIDMNSTYGALSARQAIFYYN